MKPALQKASLGDVDQLRSYHSKELHSMLGGAGVDASSASRLWDALHPHDCHLSMRSGSGSDDDFLLVDTVSQGCREDESSGDNEELTLEDNAAASDDDVDLQDNCADSSDEDDSLQLEDNEDEEQELRLEDNTADDEDEDLELQNNEPESGDDDLCLEEN